MTILESSSYHGRRRVRRMLAYKRFTSILAVTALLFSNAGSLVHVGCHKLGVACSHSEDTSLETQSSCGSCCHTCSPAKVATTVHDSPNDGTQPTEYPHEHDSDSCVICQAFATARTAAFAAAPPVIQVTLVAEPVQRAVGHRVCEPNSHQFLTRGPPAIFASTC